VTLGSRGLRLAAVFIDALVILFPVFVVTALSGYLARQAGADGRVVRIARGRYHARAV
jgi:hypothetical protein